MSDVLFQGVRKTIINFDNFFALIADQMMMVSVVIATEQFITCRAVAEIKSLNHLHRLQEAHRSIDGRKIAKLTELLMDFADGDWMFLAAQQIQDELARSGDASIVFTESAREFVKILLMPLHD